MKFSIPQRDVEELVDFEAGLGGDEHFGDSDDLGKLIGRPTTLREQTVAATVSPLALTK